jgi:hypothetical protein
MASAPADPAPPHPPAINYIASFVLVGLAWGLTTPFLRAAARDHRPPPHPSLASPATAASPLRRRALTAWFAVADLLRNPRYAVPLLLNLTGSVWFFLLIGQAGVSLPLLLFASALQAHVLLGGGGGADGMCRAEPDRAHRQHARLPLHRRWRVVG